MTEQQNNHHFQGFKLNLLYFDIKHDIFWVWFRVNNPPISMTPLKNQVPQPLPLLTFFWWILRPIPTIISWNQLLSNFLQMNPNLGILYIVFYTFDCKFTLLLPPKDLKTRKMACPQRYTWILQRYIAIKMQLLNAHNRIFPSKIHKN